jgi:hypothetical protein
MFNYISKNSLNVGFYKYQVIDRCNNNNNTVVTEISKKEVYNMKFI